MRKMALKFVAAPLFSAYFLIFGQRINVGMTFIYIIGM